MHGIPTHYDTRDEWLEARRAGIGASDIPQILNLSPWGGPFRVWIDKRFPGEVEDDVSDAMHWGIQLEGVIGEEYSQRHGVEMTQLGFTIYHHPKHEWATCTPDFAIAGGRSGDSFVEAKTTRVATGWGDHLTTEIPEHYRAQVQWQMGVLGISDIDVAVLIGGSDYREYAIAFDKELFDLMLEEVIDWRQRHIDPNGPMEAPSLDDSPIAIAFLKRRFPEDSGESAVIEKDTLALVPRLLDAKDAQRSAETARKTLENQIKNEIGSNAGLVDASGTLVATWKNSQGSAKVNWEEAFAAMTLWLHGVSDEAVERAEAFKEDFTREVPGGRRFLLKITDSYFEGADLDGE